MKRPISISIFFPTYNEEDNIVSTVRHAETAVKKITDTYEIIIVNDGSKDKTGEMADRLAMENPRVRVVHHNPNQGYGAAVLSGIKAAQYDHIFFTDADLQFDLNELEKLTDYVPEYDVVLGYRAKRQDPLIRLFNAKGWNLLNRYLFGLRVKDIDCAFKLLRRDLVKDLPIKSRGAMMSAELLIRLQRKGVQFKEVPVTHLPRERGEATGAKPAVILRDFRELFGMYKGELGGSSYVTYLQIVKFGTIGVINTFIDFVGYVSFTRLIPFFETRILAAKAISFFMGTVFSFIMNRRWTFSVKRAPTIGEVVRFYSTVGLGIFINLASVYVFHSIFGFYDIFAVIIATVITFAWGFIFSKYWVFRATREPVLFGKPARNEV
jgi:glycosyltransferase involved in cell wall biosynthesis